MPTAQQRQWMQQYIGIQPEADAFPAVSHVSAAPAPPVNGMPTAAPPTDPDAAIETALTELQALNQRLVAHGVPAKAGDDRVAALRARKEAAAKAGAKAEQALLKDIAAAHDTAQKTEDLLTDVEAILTDADNQAAQLQTDGLPIGPAVEAIIVLRKKLIPAVQAGLPTLAKLRTVAVAARDKLKRDADQQRGAMTTGALGAIKDLRDTAGNQIDQITDANVKDPLAKELDTLNGLITGLENEKDAAKFATERDAADAAARALLKKTADASLDPKKAKSALRGAYQKALKERYGIDLGGNQKLTAAHIDLEQVYETLETMPVGHVAHQKMKDITYTARLVGIGLYNGAGAEFGDISGDADNYVDPTDPWNMDPKNKKKKKLKVPKLAITVLHELGHSVDGRWHIMDGDISGDGFGAWLPLSDLSAVGTELAANYLKHGKAGGASKESLAKAIVAIINNANAIEQPADMTDAAAWKTFEKFLGRCANVLSEDFDGRGYAIGTGGWHSYSRAVRTKTQVTDYQWTAPAEWFAELYAMTWYAKRDPPSDVHPKVKQYLYSSQSGGAGAGAPATAQQGA